MVFYIFRHGETYFTKNDIPYGDSLKTAEILPESFPVIERIGNYLKGKIDDNSYTSPFKRALQTAKIVQNITGIKFRPDDRLREEELSRALETLGQMEERLRSFITDMHGIKAQNVAVCSHGWPIAALIAILTKNRITKKDLSCFPKCGELTVIEGTSVKTLDFN